MTREFDKAFHTATSATGEATKILATWHPKDGTEQACKNDLSAQILATQRALELIARRRHLREARRAARLAALQEVVP